MCSLTIKPGSAPSPNDRASERGATLVVVLILLLGMSLAAISAWYLARGDTEIAGNLRGYTQARSAADAGLIAGKRWLSSLTNPPVSATGFYPNGAPRDAAGNLTVDWDDTSAVQVTTFAGQRVAWLVEPAGLDAPAPGYALDQGGQYQPPQQRYYYRISSQARTPRGAAVVLEAIYAMDY